MENVEQTILSQFANSPRLVTLITNFNSYIDQSDNIDAFYASMWNIDTAVGYGLDVWGRILGVTRVLQVPGTQKYFGFDEATTASADPFNQSPFYSGQPVTSNFSLSDDAFQTLLFAKALANICDGSIPGINQILLTLFPGLGDCYVTDTGGMTMTYTFTFDLDPVQTAIVYQSGVLPTPVGVTASIVVP